MPRIQTFVNNQVCEEINAVIMELRQEGATKNEVNVSSVTATMIELGLRVNRIQREKKESGFNQMEYNMVMLNNIARVRAMCTEIMKMVALNHEVVSDGNFDNEIIKKSIAKFAEDQVKIFFPHEDEAD